MLDFELNTLCSDWYYYSFRLTIELNSVDSYGILFLIP